MNPTSIAVVAAAIVVWGLFSARLESWDVTGPMALVALGAVADAVGLLHISPADVPLSLVA
jgi:hypothetical protein